ncbi:hypothetical protein [Crateriforma conspicua]|uniref:hypothetical protein n=1 Tax=Crateriforma conspicua TaxID=2527996 RepID=UPI001188CD64|nr:hypothetical protein [Crateriforma conspicua]QDV61813.1 hypothetical protein Mal65_09400 [Crateriforma conspicua]
MLRSVTLLSLCFALLIVLTGEPTVAQNFQMPSSPSVGSEGFTSRAPAPNAQANPAASTARAPSTAPQASPQRPPQQRNQGTATSQLGQGGNNNALLAAAAASGKLPSTHGQYLERYDLRPYTGYLTKMDHPQQAIVDWIVRETGSDAWFHEPFGYMSASRDELLVYHSPAMHEVVSGIVDRFVAGEKDPQVLHLRVMTVGSPNWRSRAHLLMQHVSVDSPGVQAWLLTKENAAVVMSQLRARTDVRQVQALDLITQNGQSQKLASTRGRNYIRNVRPAPTGWPPYEPETGEIQEGYRLELSPLLSVDGRTIDCVLKADIDQVDKLVPVDLDLPLPNAQTHRARIDVPQVVSWRLHERFRWQSDMVLLLSCGVVASPERQSSPLPFLNTNVFTGTTVGRADALMFVEFRGRASENLTTTPLVPQMASQPGAPNRGRY